MDDDNADHHELVMPFVVCQSKNGPYEDHAFVAGYQCGELSQQMAHGETPIFVTRYRALIPQFDLISMRYGYTMDVDEEYEDELWAHI